MMFGTDCFSHHICQICGGRELDDVYYIPATQSATTPTYCNCKYMIIPRESYIALHSVDKVKTKSKKTIAQMRRDELSKLPHNRKKMRY